MLFSKFFSKKSKLCKKCLINLIILFVLILTISFCAYNFISKERTINKIEKHHSVIKKVLVEKLDYLLENSIKISKNENIKKFISNHDATSLLNKLSEEIKQNNIQTMLIADKLGEAITRIPASIQRGDNVFIINSFGRQLVKDEEIKVFDGGLTRPLLMVGGKLIKENNQIEGAIFSGQSLDDEYAQYLKDNKLHKNDNIIFYSNEKGIVGSTFKDEKIKKLLYSYYNTETYNPNDEPEKIKGINILGNRYLFKSIKLFNPENKYIGSIIISHKYNLSLINLLLSLFTAILLSGLVFYYFKRVKKISINKKYYLLIAIIIVSSCLTIFIINKFIFESSNFPKIEINNNKYIIYNSTISLKPDFDLVYNGIPHTISIEINSGGEAINAIESVLKYDPQKIQIRDVIYSRSICDEDKFIEKI